MDNVRNYQRVLFMLLSLAWFAHDARAVEYHVDASSGDDAKTGLSLAQAWHHLQFAAEHVMPGDTVLVYPGLYHEHVKLVRGGDEARPIVFRALREPGRDVIASGADRAIRARERRWQLDDARLRLYSIEHAEEPATVVVDDVNLYRFPSLSELRAFQVHNVALTGKSALGPRHGFAWAEGRLYVRLHESGKYGSTNPNEHTLKVSPARGPGFRGDEIDSRIRANWSIATDQPAWVTLDGFLCESPGFCGVWVRSGGVTIRNCRFVGCRTGVRGWDRPEKKPRQLSADVRVENCEFSEYPCYDDVLEVVAAAECLPEAERAALPRFFWWHRKAGPYSCEIGLVTAAGRRWTIHGNHVHDTLDGLSFMSLGWCEDTEVVGNRFERIIDNAVEAENHAQRLVVRGNTVIDAFEPFSYQPLDGEPWPSSIAFENNTVWLTPAGAGFWSKPILGWQRGCFKIRVADGFTRIPGDGLRAAGNLIQFSSGNLLSLSLAAVPIEGVIFERNFVIAGGLGGTERNLAPTKMAFLGNGAVRLPEAGSADKSWQMLNAGGGHTFADLPSAGIELAPDGEPKLKRGGAAAKLLGRD